MNEKIYSIDKAHAHPRAIALLTEDFFWDCADELAPFGSDEGAEALAAFRAWRRQNPSTPTIICLQWTVESVADIPFETYNEDLLDRDLIRRQKEDPHYDDQQYIFTLDASVIATGFGQLVDEGTIEDANKTVINIALERQIAWAQLSESRSYAEQHIGYLNIMKQILDEA